MKTRFPSISGLHATKFYACGNFSCNLQLATLNLQQVLYDPV